MLLFLIFVLFVCLLHNNRQAFSLIVLRHTFIQLHVMNNRKIKSTHFNDDYYIVFFSSFVLAWSKSQKHNLIPAIRQIKVNVVLFCVWIVQGFCLFDLCCELKTARQLFAGFFYNTFLTLHEHFIRKQYWAYASRGLEKCSSLDLIWFDSIAISTK